jgi:hypothetical protein
MDGYGVVGPDGSRINMGGLAQPGCFLFNPRQYCMDLCVSTWSAADQVIIGRSHVPWAER